MAVLVVSYAAFDAIYVHSQRDCPLGMIFERSGSDVLQSRAFPPMVECRYEYLTGDNGTAIGPPETVTYDALTSLVFAVVSVAIASAVVVGTSRLDRRYATDEAEMRERAWRSAQQ